MMSAGMPFLSVPSKSFSVFLSANSCITVRKLLDSVTGRKRKVTLFSNFFKVVEQKLSRAHLPIDVADALLRKAFYFLKVDRQAC